MRWDDVLFGVVVVVLRYAGPILIDDLVSFLDRPRRRAEPTRTGPTTGPRGGTAP
ncbi:MAG: hypothetical protein JOZ63_12215 [Planctomycetaceae bacterium]|nr:hypothetical protein [Planctomycetaceae bacterium]